jgi:glycosyltransferase involved in cell wall biosynthesis
MKILYVHSYYRQRGGEDSVFEQEVALMRQTDEVKVLAFHNKEGWKGGLQFFLSIWNLRVARRMKKEIREFSPDIIHIHNLHFGVGPITIRVAAARRIPVVLTLHNYRLLCPSGTILHKGELLTESITSRFPWKAIRKKAYRDSMVLSFWLAFIVWFHKRIGTWAKVDRYIVLTDFAKSLFLRSAFHLPAEKIEVKPNFVDVAPNGVVPRGEHFLFIGRLSEEKGIRLLLEGFSKTGHSLRIVGDGPLEDIVRRAVEQNPHIEYLGRLDRKEVQGQMLECTALVFPSIWYEGLPLTIVEAFATRTPVIAGNLGAMASMIRHGQNGLHFEAGTASALAGQTEAWRRMTSEEKEAFRKKALETYQNCYTAEKNRRLMHSIYEQML